MTNNSSIFTATLRLSATTYHPVRVAKTGLIAGLTSFVWKKEYEVEDEDKDGTYDARSSSRNFQERDLWLTEEEANELIMVPEAYMTEDMKSVFKSQHRNWELFVTEYKPQQAKVYTHADTDGKRKALRKAAILAKMSVEDRALFS